MKKFYNGRTNIKHKKTYNMVKIGLFERLEIMKKMHFCCWQSGTIRTYKGLYLHCGLSPKADHVCQS